MPNQHTPPEYLNLKVKSPVTVAPNTYLPSALADILVEALPDDVQVPIEGGGSYINQDHVPAVAGLLLEIVAYTVASLIDAGSERDAVMENGSLYRELELELKGWSIVDMDSAGS